MLGFIKQAFTRSLYCGKSLATKYISLVNKPCVDFANLNSDKRKWYSLLVSLNRRGGNCDTIVHL